MLEGATTPILGTLVRGEAERAEARGPKGRERAKSGVSFLGRGQSAPPPLTAKQARVPVEAL